MASATQATVNAAYENYDLLSDMMLQRVAKPPNQNFSLPNLSNKRNENFI